MLTHFMSVVRGAANHPVASIAVALLARGLPAAAAVTQAGSPGDLAPSLTTLDFDDYPHHTAANELYLSRGVRFTRDDAGQTTIYEPVMYRAHSGTNFLSTPRWDGAPSGWSTHLNAWFTSPVREVGAFFGNDWEDPNGIERLTLSVFDADGRPLGSVWVQTNHNRELDQFIGLRSDVPFVHARFEHDASQYAVAIDDLSYSTVPEPLLLTSLAGTVAGLATQRRRRRRRRRTYGNA